MIDLLDKFFNQNKGVRRLALVWACCIITYSTVMLYSNLPLITEHVASAYQITCGLLTGVLALYQWQRNREEKGGDE